MQPGQEGYSPEEKVFLRNIFDQTEFSVQSANAVAISLSRRMANLANIMKLQVGLFAKAFTGISTLNTFMYLSNILKAVRGCLSVSKCSCHCWSQVYLAA